MRNLQSVLKIKTQSKPSNKHYLNATYVKEPNKWVVLQKEKYCLQNEVFYLFCLFTLNDITDFRIESSSHQIQLVIIIFSSHFLFFLLLTHCLVIVIGVKYFVLTGKKLISGLVQTFLVHKSYLPLYSMKVLTPKKENILVLNLGITL